jgi:hypothetical protein
MCVQFLHAINDYVTNIADTQANASFALGELISRPSTAAVHWYTATFDGVQNADNGAAGPTAR